jgi:nucleotide-binding universal stress UspA family protein
MKTLLVLVSHPEASGWYIKYAIGLARELHLKIHLYYVVNPAGQLIGTPHLTGEVAEQLQHNLKDKAIQARDSLTNQANSIIQKNDGQVVLEVSSIIGNEIAQINQMVKDGKAHMLMLARENEGNSGFKPHFVNEVSRNVNCPVWIIPENSRYQSIDSIIYATDYQEEDISTLKKLINLTHFVSPEITALHITGNPDFELRIKNAGFQKILQSKTGYDDLTVKALVEKNGGGIPEMISEFASQIQSKLIVVLKDNKQFFERVLNPDISNKIVQEAAYPVLVYHTAEEA